MKIVHLFCYPGNGGAEKYSLYLSYEAKKSGHEVSFILGAEGPMIDQLRNKNYKHKIISMPSWYNLRAIRQLKGYFEENSTQIVHTHFLREHFLAVFAKLLGANVKVVRTFHRLDQLPARVRPFYWFIQRKTDAFIAISKHIRAHLIKSGINEKKITLIYNGVPQINCQKHTEGIGFIGRLTKEKGIKEFVESNLGQLKTQKFVVAGDGPESANIKKLINDNKLNIELMGNVDNQQDFFENISVLILPSKTEVMPLVVLEAYSIGVPVVCFDIEPLREIIEKKFMASPGDYSALLRLAQNYSKVDLSEKLKTEYRSKYTVSKMADETETLYRSLLS